MVNLLEEFAKQQSKIINDSRGGLSSFVPNFRSGDTVRVKYKIIEGSTIRSQAFVGIVIARSKSFENYSATFTVRKISSGVGVERNFPLYSPLVSSIELIKRGVVRRAKLYYLRSLTGKASRIREKLDFLSVSAESQTSSTDNGESS